MCQVYAKSSDFHEEEQSQSVKGPVLVWFGEDVARYAINIFIKISKLLKVSLMFFILL